MNLFQILFDTIFPEKCVGCGVPGFLVCNICKTKLTPATTPEHNFIYSVFAYSNPVIRKLIHKLKYENGRYVARFFAPYVHSALLEFLGEEKLFHGNSRVLLVPVPLSKNRIKKRGYNQSEILIKYILKNNQTENIFLENSLVVKIKDTVPQAEIKKKNIRLANQIDCFEIRKNKVSKNDLVILIDDVTTTGATLVAIRDLLKKDGFKKVYAFTIAH